MECFCASFPGRQMFIFCRSSWMHNNISWRKRHKDPRRRRVLGDSLVFNTIPYNNNNNKNNKYCCDEEEILCFVFRVKKIWWVCFGQVVDQDIRHCQDVVWKICQRGKNHEISQECTSIVGNFYLFIIVCLYVCVCVWVLSLQGLILPLLLLLYQNKDDNLEILHSKV